MDFVKTYKMRSFGYYVIKRVFDVTVSAIALIILSPLFIILALLVSATSEGSVFFKHKRLGLNKKEFFMFKFRTMLINAEQIKSQFSADQINELKSSYKLKNDPRVTALGGILRKSSLDELPQLINVLKGDMSIVGPRPITEEELEKYGDYADMLMSVNPGITGLWQVSGRSNTSYEERVKLDVQYIQQSCILMDLKIFYKTFKEVFLLKGAC